MKDRTCLVLATLATLLATVDSLVIRTSPIQTIPDSYGLQTTEKTWTVTSSAQLRSLLVDIPGAVFVNLDTSLKKASDVVAQIVVSGDSRELIDVFEVVPRESAFHSGSQGQQSLVREDSVKLHLKNVNATVSGRVLTQIFVADRSVLRELSVTSTSNVVVGDSVLANNDPSVSVSLSIVGSGSLFVASSDNFTVESLKTYVVGAGAVLLDVSSIQAAGEVLVSLFGHGRVALQGCDITAQKLVADTSGSGDVFVQTDNLQVYDLNIKTSGSGSVYVSKSGSCTKQTISIHGSGFVATGSVVCQDTDVAINGQGGAVVQTTERLTVFTVKAGSVKYVNRRPNIVQESTLFLHTSAVSQADKNEFKTYTAAPAPPQAPAQLRLVLRENLRSKDPKVVALEPSGLVAAAYFGEPGGWRVLAVAGIAGVAFVGVGVLVGNIRRRSRAEYAPIA